MPTPTCASWIMGTSLAPSPMDIVTGVGLIPSRTKRTISAFCNGDTRHAMTTSHCTARYKNSCFFAESAIIDPRAAPVTNIPCFLHERHVPPAPRSTSPLTSRSMMKMSMSSSSTFEVIPMSRAVSSLSPVNTHSLMPAALMLTMVSGTSSCNLSSTAVTPTISIFCSISSATSANAPSRFRKAFSASRNFIIHASTSSRVKVRLASNRVLNPSLANFVT
mmetsp:Transcript_32645/g.87641  ORF Transcript_32645/g.87641 Transcript_32645/m.87641 type:complete len:220 (+) Transcript_32645:292-951(+)